jgi:hypothetical protein
VCQKADTQRREDARKQGGGLCPAHSQNYLFPG